MKCFHCDHCQQLVFFENFVCIQCNHRLAFLPDVTDVASLEPAGPDVWQARTPAAQNGTYRLCLNDMKHNVCNWAVTASDPNPLCLSCRLTRIIPDLSIPDNKQAWFRLESAKRRLIYSLLNLRLPIATRFDDPVRGLAFEFKADPPSGASNAAPVLTGHADGIITVNIAEADHAEREKRRAQLGEPYRTPLGHFRHEIGHYYWDRLISKSPRIEDFRRMFGDERKDYGEALKEYYARGAPINWQERFISAYATSHPWEDWAESWAHYLHMVDALETAADTGLSLKPRRENEPALNRSHSMVSRKSKSFDRMIDHWFPLTYVLNNLNRGLGLTDGYPFVLSLPVIEKLRFIHDTIETYRDTLQPVSLH